MLTNPTPIMAMNGMPKTTVAEIAKIASIIVYI